MHLKLHQKEQFKNQQKKVAIQLDKTADKITRALKNSSKNNSKAKQEEIFQTKIYICRTKKKKMIHDIRLKEGN